MSDDETLPTFDDALRLVLAFYCIMESEKRAVVSALIAEYADPARLQATNAQLDSTAELIADVKRHLLQSELLVRQRRYAEHLQALQFSVLEDAIYRMTPDASMRAGDKV